MPEAWLNFIIVIFTQLLLFIVCAWYTKKFSDILHILGWGVLIAIVVGVPFDLIVGKFLGLHSFALGFSMSFLIINAIFSYGLFTANILLMQHVRLSHFIILNIILIAVYEIINNFFPVWTWKFELPPIKFVMIIMVGYFAGAILVATISHIFLRRHFSFINNLFKK